MVDVELLKITLKRHGLTIRGASIVWGVSPATLASWLSGRRKITPNAWVTILEYEARLYQRQQDIAERAAMLHTAHPPTPAVTVSKPARKSMKRRNTPKVEGN